MNIGRRPPVCDGPHRFTARPAATYGTVVVENLDSTGAWPARSLTRDSAVQPDGDGDAARFVTSGDRVPGAVGPVQL